MLCIAEGSEEPVFGLIHKDVSISKVEDTRVAVFSNTYLSKYDGYPNFLHFLIPQLFLKKPVIQKIVDCFSDLVVKRRAGLHPRLYQLREF